MTAHVLPDTLIFKGEEYHPLNYHVLFTSYLEQHRIELPKDPWTWRGYVAEWKIRDNMLFLTGLQAILPKSKYRELFPNQSNGPVKSVGIDRFFPGQQQVLADWYSGDLTIFKCEKPFEESVYITFTVDKGHIVQKKHQTTEEFMCFTE